MICTTAQALEKRLQIRVGSGRWNANHLNHLRYDIRSLAGHSGLFLALEHWFYDVHRSVHIIPKAAYKEGVDK